MGGTGGGGFMAAARHMVAAAKARARLWADPMPPMTMAVYFVRRGGFQRVLACAGALLWVRPVYYGAMPASHGAEEGGHDNPKGPLHRLSASQGDELQSAVFLYEDGGVDVHRVRRHATASALQHWAEAGVASDEEELLPQGWATARSRASSVGGGRGASAHSRPRGGGRFGEDGGVGHRRQQRRLVAPHVTQSDAFSSALARQVLRRQQEALQVYTQGEGGHDAVHGAEPPPLIAE